MKWLKIDLSGQIMIFTLISLILLTALPAHAQQPFLTDDADVTDKGKIHFEITNEFDQLQALSLPIEYQNGIRATIAYGLVKNVEISLGGQFLAFASRQDPRLVGGIGDTTISLKYNFRHEHKDSRVPALTINVFLQAPTGNPRRSLGSGVTDYGFYGVGQKTVGDKNTFRVNGGYLFAGNTLTGVLGISSVRGHVFTGSASYVRKINEKLQLGAELTGAVTSNFQLSKGQLQTQFGGNYQLSKKTSFDFGFIAGKFAASPHLGFQLGFSHDF